MLATAELLRQARDAHRFVQSEQFTNLIQVKQTLNKDRLLQGKIEALFAQEKRYYTYQLLVELFKTRKMPEIASLSANFLRSQPISKLSLKQDPSIAKAMKLCQEKFDDASKVIFLSVIPSMCDFFITENGIERYKRAIFSLENEIAGSQQPSQPLKDELAWLLRPAFLSPSFIKFVTKVYTPVFDWFIFGEESEEKLSHVSSDVCRLAAENAYLFPRFIFDILKGDFPGGHLDFPIGPGELLRQGFLNPASESPEEFALVPPYMTKAELKCLDTVFSALSTDSHISQLLDIVAAASTDIVFTSTSSLPEFFPDLSLLFSSIDLSVIDRSVNPKSNYTLISSFAFDHIKGSPAADERSFVADNRGDVALRNLFKISPLIPKCTRSNDFITSMREFLLTSENTRALCTRCALFSTFEESIDSGRSIPDSLESMKIFHLKELAKVTRLKRSVKLQDVLQVSLATSIEHIMQVLILMNMAQDELPPWADGEEVTHRIASELQSHILAKKYPFKEFVESNPFLIELNIWADTAMRKRPLKIYKKIALGEHFAGHREELTRILSYNFDPFEKARRLNKLEFEVKFSLPYSAGKGDGDTDTIAAACDWLVGSSHYQFLVQNLVYILKYAPNEQISMILSHSLFPILETYQKNFGENEIFGIFRREFCILVAESEESFDFLSSLTNVTRKLIVENSKTRYRNTFVWNYRNSLDTLDFNAYYKVIFCVSPANVNIKDLGISPDLVLTTNKDLKFSLKTKVPQLVCATNDEFKDAVHNFLKAQADHK